MYTSGLEVHHLHLLSQSTLERSRAAAQRSSLHQALVRRRAESRRRRAERAHVPRRAALARPV